MSSIFFLSGKNKRFNTNRNLLLSNNFHITKLFNGNLFKIINITFSNTLTMNVYTTEEKIQMVTWNLAGNSLRRTCELFSVYFNERPVPCKHTVARIVKQFRETGCVNSLCKRNTNQNQNVNNEVDILAAVEADPNVSVREIANNLGVSRSYVHRTLKKHKYFAYKYSMQQELLAADSEKRIAFCELMFNKCHADEHFLENICFTDECTFTLNGEPNRQNYRYWSQNNQHLYVQSHTQYRQSLNVWVGILGDNLIGPFFIDGTLNSRIYLDMLQNQIVPAITAVVDDINTVWYQNDGAPAHYSREVRNYLNEAFPNRWIGRGGPINWSPRSPDLSPNDFFLWGFLKSKIYTSRRHTNLESLKDSIMEACFNITPQTLRNVRRNFYDRLSHCLLVNGNTFEHLIH